MNNTEFRDGIRGPLREQRDSFGRDVPTLPALTRRATKRSRIVESEFNRGIRDNTVTDPEVLNRLILSERANPDRIAGLHRS
jgi:hypothetical protein